MELKSQEQLKKELSAPLPKEAVKPHPTKTYLSSIKAIYVTERLNDVFGIGKWSTKVKVVEKGSNGMVVVKTTLQIPDYNIYYECFGGNDNGGENSKNFDLGDAYKGATTDAITKIGSYLGIGIEVFKGQVTPTPAKQSENLPWLNENTPEWTQVLTELRGGISLADIKAKFKISKAGEAKLLEEAKSQPKQVADPSTAENVARMQGKKTEKLPDDVKAEISKCKTVPELTVVFNKHTQWHISEEFMEYLKIKKEEIQSNQ